MEPYACPKRPSTSIPGPPPTATRSTSCWRSAACPTARTRSTSARATSSSPAFLKISPNNKIPAITDPEGPDGKPISLFESGAILVYLAGKTGRFMPEGDRGALRGAAVADVPDGRRRPDARPDPSLPLYAPEKIAYAIDRYSNEARAPLRRDRQAARQRTPSSPATSYSIADIAIFPWLRSWENQGIVLTDFPHLKKWFEGIAARPAVQRGVKVLADLRQPITGDKEREVLFGKTQYERR